MYISVERIASTTTNNYMILKEVFSFLWRKWLRSRGRKDDSAELVAAYAQLSRCCSSPGGTGVQEEEEEERKGWKGGEEGFAR